MLELKGVSKTFGEVKALSGINISIGKNEVVGLLGPNGAGKTTLMRILVGFMKADEGEIIWDGEKVSSKEVGYKKRIGYLPENNPLYGTMTVNELLRMMAALKGLDKREIENEVRVRSEECGISKVLSKKIETLSKGYRQRVGLAAAILGNPDLLILDEPTSGLDPNQVIEIRKLIKSMAKTKAVLFSTHVLPEAKSNCRKLIIINRGRIVLNQATNKIRNLEKKFIELTE